NESAARFSVRSSIHLTGAPVTIDAATAITYPGYAGTLPPKPPPISGEIIRIFSSDNPRCPVISATTVRIACGACEVIHSVRRVLTASHLATQPQVSMDAT